MDLSHAGKTRRFMANVLLVRVKTGETGDLWPNFTRLEELGLKPLKLDTLRVKRFGFRVNLGVYVKWLDLEAGMSH